MKWDEMRIRVSACWVSGLAQLPFKNNSCRYKNWRPNSLPTDFRSFVGTDRKSVSVPPALLVNWFERNDQNSCAARLKMHGALDSNSCVTCVTCLCIACLKVQWTAVSKPLLCWEHSQHFPTSPLRQYCAGSLLLDFGSQKRSGVLIGKERSNLCAAHLTMQWSAGFKICKTVWALSCLTSEVQRYSVYKFETNDQNSCAAHLKMYWSAGSCVTCITLHETAVSKLMRCVPLSAVNCCIQT